MKRSTRSTTEALKQPQHQQQQISENVSIPTSRIDISLIGNEENDNHDLDWDEIEQSIAQTHPLYKMNIKRMAEFLEQNYLLSKFVGPRERHDIEFLIQLGKDENLKDLSSTTKNWIKKRMALFYYITRYGWGIALQQMRNIEADLLGIPPVNQAITASSLSYLRDQQQTSSDQIARGSKDVSSHKKSRS